MPGGISLAIASLCEQEGWSPRYLVIAIPNKMGFGRSELKALGQAFRGARGLGFGSFGGSPRVSGLVADRVPGGRRTVEKTHSGLSEAGIGG